MYSLPITTYSDYWRRTKSWSAYFGSVAVLAASTRYSALEELDLSKTMHPPLQLVDSVSVNKHEQISRGISGLSRENQEENNNQGEAVNELGTRVTSTIQILNKEIPFNTEYIESDELSPGTSQVHKKGENGIRREVVKTFEVGGQPVDQQVQSFFELKSPKNEVIIRNTKPLSKKKVIIQNPNSGSTQADVDLSKLPILKTLSVEATAYTYTGNNTATGVRPREGLIAVDPKVIAMGTKVYVEGYGYAVAADTGGDIRGNRIDVFFSTLRQCIDWGRKPVKIHILNPT